MASNAEAKVFTAHFDSRDLPPEARVAEFERITPGYDTLLPDGGKTLSFECHGWLLGDLVLTANQLSAMELLRSPEHIRAYARDTYTLILAQRGRWWAELDYGTVHVGSGQVCIMDFTVPWHVYGTAQQNVMLVIPRPVVDAAAPKALRLHGKLLEGAAGRLFAEHLVALARNLKDMKQAAIPLIRDVTVALLANALGALPVSPGTPTKSQAMRAAANRVHAFIDDNLTAPDLSSGRICCELAITRPTLYRAFSSHGGVSAFIQRRRLEAAHSQLSDTNVSESMAEIADQYCFSSPSHFSTAFRRRFGYTPRDAKMSPRVVRGTTELFNTYLGALGKEEA